METPLVKSKRIQSSEIIKTNLNPARENKIFRVQVKLYQDHYMVEEIDRLDTETTKVDASSKESFKKVITHRAEKQHASLKIGVTCYNVCTLISEKMCHHLFDLACLRAISLGRNKVSVEHLYGNDITSMALYPLIAGIDVVQTGMQSAKRRQYVDNVVTRFGVSKEDAEKFALLDYPVDETAKFPDSKELESFVKDLFNNVMKSHADYAKLTLTDELKQHVAEIIVKLTLRLAMVTLPLVELQSMRTFTDAALMKSVKAIMLNYNRPDAYEYLRQYINNSMQSYYEHHVGVVAKRKERLATAKAAKDAAAAAVSTPAVSTPVVEPVVDQAPVVPTVAPTAAVAAPLPKLAAAMRSQPIS